MPRLLIVNADDFGLSDGVNEGIIEAHTNGVVTSASLMVERPAAEQAAELARRHPSLSVGLHFDGDALDLDDPAKAATAFSDQLERFRALLGQDPTHVDSHHHIHTENERLTIFSELVGPLGVPLRHDGRVRYLGGFWGRSESGAPEPENVGRQFLLELVRTEVSDGLTEIGCHPAKVTGDFTSSYLQQRTIERQTLTEPGLRAEIDALGVKLVSFRAWGSDPQPARAGAGV